VDRPTSEFVRQASHELRTPLTAILGYAEVLLAEPVGLSDQQVQHLEAIQRNAIRLEQTIADLLAAARVGAEAPS